MAWKYRVKDWDENFESAKSKTYKHKRQCYMPSKHGLGYRVLVQRENGAAIFGAWCAMIQVLSRQVDREGYLTDTTLKDGAPLTARQISISTDMPESIISEMLEVTSSEDVVWLEVNEPVDCQDTIVPCQDTTKEPQSPYPLPLPLPSPCVEPLPSEPEEETQNSKGDYIQVIWKAWSEEKIQDSKIVTSPNDIQAIRTASASYELQDIIDAIKKYSEILNGDSFLLTTRWTLAKFLNEHITKFFPGSKPEDTYQNRGKRRTHRRPIAEIIADTKGAESA